MAQAMKARRRLSIASAPPSTMDFVEGFPKVGGRSVVLTVVVRFSKMAHFLPLSHPYTAITVARVFFDTIVKLHGLPCSIVSEGDPEH
jgi:hypothetical protein